ncbi:hypothetical protein D1007_52834 [Hordeum vulgare]|nr:hypothetical protein D1007_52834 [Hordeum vulgare]
MQESGNDFSYVVPPVLLRDMLLDEFSAIFAKNSASILDHRFPLKSACHDAPLQTDLLSDVLDVDAISLLKKAEMSNTKISLLSEIHDKEMTWNAKVVASRMWHYRGGSDNGPIVHTDVVGTHMYGQIPPGPTQNLKDILEEGKPGIEEDYPYCTYNLISFSDIPVPGPNTHRFLDVIGRITMVTNILVVHSQYKAEPSDTRTIVLEDQAGNEISLVLWDARAREFDAEEVRTASNAGAVIAIFVGTLPKMYRGVKGLSGSSACRWYIDEELPEMNAFRASLSEGLGPVTAHIPGEQPMVATPVREPPVEMNVKELLALDPFDNLKKQFMVKVVIQRLGSDHRWWFLSCRECHKTTYCLCSFGSDGSAEAEFMFFDKAARSVTGKPLMTLIHHKYPDFTNVHDLAQIGGSGVGMPVEISRMVNQKYVLVVSISSKSFQPTSTQLSFQVNRIDQTFTPELATLGFGGTSHASAASSSTQNSGATVPILKPFAMGSSMLTIVPLDEMNTPISAFKGKGQAVMPKTPSKSPCPKNSRRKKLFASPSKDKRPELAGCAADVVAQTKKTAATDDVAEAITVTDETKQVGQETETASAEDDKNGLYDQSKTKRVSPGFCLLNKLSLPLDGYAGQESFSALLHNNNGLAIRFLLRFFESQQVFSRNSKTTVFDPFSSFAKLASSFYEHNLYPQARRIKLSSPVCEDGETSKNRVADLAIEYMETSEQKVLVDYNYYQLEQHKKACATASDRLLEKIEEIKQRNKTIKQITRDASDYVEEVRDASKKIHSLAAVALDPATSISVCALKKAILEIHGAVAALQSTTAIACPTLQEQGIYSDDNGSDPVYNSPSDEDSNEGYHQDMDDDYAHYM